MGKRHECGPRLTKGGTTSMVGGLVAAFLASICCIGPVVFAALGIGVGATGFLAGTAGMLKALLPYRPAFVAMTMALLGISFYLAYRKPESVCAEGMACISGATPGASRTLTWLFAILAIALVLAPYWLGL